MKARMPVGLAQGLPDNGDVEVNFLAVQYWNILPVLKKVEGDTITLASRNPCTWFFNGKYYEVGAVSFCATHGLARSARRVVRGHDGGQGLLLAAGRHDGRQKVTAPTNELVRLQGDDLAARSNEWRVKFDAPASASAAPALALSSPSAFERLVRHVEFDGLTLSAPTGCRKISGRRIG